MAKLCITCDHQKDCKLPKLNYTDCSRYSDKKYRERLELENTEFNYGHNVEHYHTNDDGEIISEKNPLRHYD